MAVFEITQRLMSVSAEYEIRKENDKAVEPAQIVKGELMTSSPYRRLKDGTSKTVIAILEGNVVKTRFQIRDPKGEELALVNFPAVDLRNAFTMSVNGRGYHACGVVVAVVKHVFECKGNDGKVVLTLSKEPSIRDRFLLETQDEAAIPQEVAVLVAVAVHSRFYEGADPRRSSGVAVRRPCPRARPCPSSVGFPGKARPERRSRIRNCPSRRRSVGRHIRRRASSR